MATSGSKTFTEKLRPAHVMNSRTKPITSSPLGMLMSFFSRGLSALLDRVPTPSSSSMARKTLALSSARIFVSTPCFSRVLVIASFSSSMVLRSVCLRGQMARRPFWIVRGAFSKRCNC